MNSSDFDWISREIRSSLPTEVLAVERINQGRNSSCSKVLLEGVNFVLKDYSNLPDAEARFLRESFTLQLVSSLGISNGPEIVALDKKRFQIATKFIDGNSPEEISRNFLNSLSVFLGELNSNHAKIESSPLSRDAYLGQFDIFADIEVRHSSISPKANLSVFRESHTAIYDCFRRFVVHNTKQVNEVRKAFSLANSKNFFSPSDLGLHNSIENKLGFFFVDFEYAGLDSPLKMLFDLIANPSNQINSLELMDQDETIFRKYLSMLSSRQITDFHFLFMIKWYFILLNIILKQKPDVKVVENLKMLESKIGNFNG